MLSNIWVGVRAVIHRAACFRNRWSFAQRRGGLFGLGMCAINGPSLF
jgi:hypothetical protein